MAHEEQHHARPEATQMEQETEPLPVFTNHSLISSILYILCRPLTLCAKLPTPTDTPMPGVQVLFYLVW